MIRTKDEIDLDESSSLTPPFSYECEQHGGVATLKPANTVPVLNLINNQLVMIFLLLV
jgi:hypothetical protein